jgi:TetR/AcrR family transcriptional repressor of lmrAB and yxaGH operons
MTRRQPADPEPSLSKGERTRKKLVDATATLLQRQGYHATGLSQIVEESGAPRGSLYFYFPDGKDELAIAALAQSGEKWRARVEEAVAAATDLGDAITRIVEAFADELEASNWENGCPVAAVALEAVSKPVRKAVVAHYTAWQDNVSAALTERFGVPAAMAAQFATVALAAIEGALLLARVHRSREPLITVGRALQAMAALRA